MEEKVKLTQRLFLDILRDTGYAPDPELVRKVAENNSLSNLKKTYELLKYLNTPVLEFREGREKIVARAMCYYVSMAIDETGKILSMNIYNYKPNERIRIVR
ncbi:MAG: hypothetical protein QXX38_01460 [Candidatus Aenigmatarchaeota archaeon]